MNWSWWLAGGVVLFAVGFGFGFFIRAQLELNRRTVIEIDFSGNRRVGL